MASCCKPLETFFAGRTVNREEEKVTGWKLGALLLLRPERCDHILAVVKGLGFLAACKA